MTTAVFECYNFRAFRRRLYEKTVEVFPIRVVRDPMVNLQIVPDKTVFSGRAVESILYTFHSMYEGVMDRFWNEGLYMVFKTRDHASFRIVYQSGSITFHLSVPSSFEDVVRHSVHNVWPKATVRSVPASYLDRLDPSISKVAFLELKEHFFKSTLVDRSRLEPVPSLMAAGRNLLDDDLAVLDVAYVPVSDRSWHARAREARNKYRAGREPFKMPSKWSDLLFLLGDLLVDGVIEKAFGLLDAIMGESKKDASVDLTRAGRELRPSTEQKFTHSGFDMVVRIASQSKQTARAEKTLTAIGTAFKDISADNELEIRKVADDGRVFKPTTRFLERLKDDRLPSRLFASNIVSVPEASQVLQLPSAPLQEEYPEIEQLSYREQRLPSSILDGSAPGVVPLGVSTGVDPETLHIPGGMSSSAKDDRCKPGVVCGGVGSGKTAMATNQSLFTFGAHLPFDEWKKAGRSVFVYDVTGGKTIRDFLAACPPDRRHRVKVIDYGLSDRRPSLSWQVPDMDAETAADLAAQTVQFVELATQQTMGPQTRRWLVIHSMAAFEANPDNTVLEAIQSLTDDAYRLEKIVPSVRNRSILRELRIFAAMTPEQRSAVVAPILNRLYMLTTEHPRLWECVAQRPIRDSSGRLVNDYRLFMDGDADGPYAVLVNVPPSDERGRLIAPSIQQAVMLGEASKLWAATLTRNPQDPDLKEFLVIYDEPHQFMKGTPFFKRMFLEMRKYRGRPYLFFHEWKSIKDPELSAAILGAGPNIHVLYGSNANFEKLEPYLSPFTSEEFMAMPKHYAINRISASGAAHVFMCRLMPPLWEDVPGVKNPYPIQNYELGSVWRDSAVAMSRDVEVVRNDIFDREGESSWVEMPDAVGEPAQGGDLDCLKD